MSLSQPTRPTSLTRLQWLIVLGYLVLALLYGALNPPWEAHDETGHAAYVDHLATTGRLPDASASEKVLFDQSHQPPLYYLVAAALTAWADRSDGVGPQFNHFALEGSNRRGFRIMLRQTGEAFPWRGTILALHAARAVSAMLGGLTIYLIARSANLLFTRGSRAATLSTAIAAFNPQVIFMGAMVNNDVMAAATGALVAHLTLHIASCTACPAQPATRDAQPARHAQRDMRYPLLGLALGLAFLSKNSALALIGFVALALTFIARRQGWHWRELVGRGAITFAAFAAIAAPYLIYNFARYGRLLVDRDPNNPILAAPVSLIGEGVMVSLRDAWLPQLFANTFRTFWGKFGWGNVGLPEWAYLAFAGFSLVGVVGCAVAYRRASRELCTALIVLIMLGVSMMVLPLYRALSFHDPALLPGRYIMPALTAYACALGLGWSSVTARGLARPAIPPAVIATALATALAAFALIVPFVYIRPRYAPHLSADPTGGAALLTFGDLVQLREATAQTAFLPDREGMRHYARVKLTWRALRPETHHYAFGISVLGRNNEVLGSINAFPNLGNYPSTNWRAGDTFVDEYDILLEKPCAQLPALGRLSVSVYPLEPLTATRPISITSIPLPARDGEGRVVAPIVGRFKIEAAPPFPVFWQPPLGRFEGIWLRDVRLPATARPGETVTVILTYELIQPTDKVGTAFVHLLDAGGAPVAQDDHAPLDGNYPTDLWEAGECVRETFALSIPAQADGELQAVTGFYAADGARFRTGLPNDVVPLGTIELAAEPPAVAPAQ